MMNGYSESNRFVFLETINVFAGTFKDLLTSIKIPDRLYDILVSNTLTVYKNQETLEIMQSITLIKPHVL